MGKQRLNTFVSSIFFVLGFSVVFSVLGILLQTTLSGIAFQAQKWVVRVGGLLIVLFGIYLLMQI